MARRTKKTLEHEPAEFAARRILFVGAGLLVSVVVLSAIMLAVIRQPHSAQRSAFVESGGDVPSPRLQSKPSDDYSHYLAEKRAQLESSGWLDSEHRVAHIPIEQAMDDIARRSGATTP